MVDRSSFADTIDAGASADQVTAVYAETLTDREFATTLARGLFILRSFTPDQPALGNKDLVERTGLPKATISRFTYTLCRLGYLRQLPGQSKYQLASGILSLGYPVLASMRLRQLARRRMDVLASDVHGSVAIGVRAGLNMVCVETSLSDSGDSPPYTHIGYEHPMVMTSMGHAFLASSTEVARSALLNEIKVKQPDLWRRYSHPLGVAIEHHQRAGFCMSFDSYRPGIYGVSVPFPRHVDCELPVFNCTVFATAVTRDELEQRIAPKLVALVNDVDASMRKLEKQPWLPDRSSDGAWSIP